jgi:hypothetical protein
VPDESLLPTTSFSDIWLDFTSLCLISLIK